MGSRATAGRRSFSWLTKHTSKGMATTARDASSATSRPDRHTQRYDRQLRLWNRSGQSALEQAHVLVVGASSLAAQILKNLVLPGLGHCTIWDGTCVHEDDVHSNFFLQSKSVGKPYASELARLVGELNPTTRADAVVQVRRATVVLHSRLKPSSHTISLRTHLSCAFVNHATLQNRWPSWRGTSRHPCLCSPHAPRASRQCYR